MGLRWRRLAKTLLLPMLDGVVKHAGSESNVEPKSLQKEQLGDGGAEPHGQEKEMGYQLSRVECRRLSHEQ
jgi:hypothetical protein